MSIGLRAMTANYAALETTGHNIANAGVVGYSRQSVEFATSKGQFTGAGFFGRGVEVANVNRAHDKFLTMQAIVARSMAAMDGSRAEQLLRLEGVFPPGEGGLGYAIGDFLNAMSDVANNPGDISAREVVLARAREVSALFASSDAELDAMQTGVNQDLSISVTQVNEITARIAELNNEIAKFNGTNRPPNDLLDARDQAISDLSAYIPITTLPADDGSIGVFLTSGQRLVLGGDVQKLTLVAHPMDPQRKALALDENGFVNRIDERLLTSGSVSGLLRFQNEDLVDARNMIGQMALALSTRVNEMQALGLDLTGEYGAPIFSAGFGTGLPQAVPSVLNELGPDGLPIGQVALSIVDGSALQASDYEMIPDPLGRPGLYQVTRLTDGVVFQVEDGDVVDGMQITITTPLERGDVFLLRPVTAGAEGMKVVLDDPRGLAAANPVTASADVANIGTGTVGALTVGDGVDAARSTTITFGAVNPDGTIAYTWEMDNPADSGTGTWTAGSPIELNGFALQINGVPSENDVFSVTPTTQPDANNGNAQAMLNLRDEAFVGRTDGKAGATVTDAYAAAMADIGVRTQSAQIAAELSASAEEQALEAKLSVSGVNLDEEAARLIQFQQAYQAAAKVLEVAQGLFDTMLSVSGN